jgi:phosphatidylcholine synthase
MPADPPRDTVLPRKAQASAYDTQRAVRPDKRRVAQAWAVHVFTASGVVLGFLALIAIIEGDMRAVFLYLGLALFVDGIDGTLARRVKVREVIPQVDGATLDNVIDYFNYVAVPAMMIYWFDFVPAGWETPAAAAVMLASCYTFANTDIKTNDYWFQGFPAVWNVVVLAFYILGTGQWVNLAIIALCLGLTFVPWKYVHPFRVRALRHITIPVTVLWLGATLRLILVDEGAPREAQPLVFWLWVGASAYFLGMSAWRSMRRDRN